MYSYLSLAFLYPWLTSIHKTENFQQKGHGVSHNPPQVDKVLPLVYSVVKEQLFERDFSLYSFHLK